MEEMLQMFIPVAGQPLPVELIEWFIAITFGIAVLLFAVMATIFIWGTALLFILLAGSQVVRLLKWVF